MNSETEMIFNRDDWWDKSGAFRLLHDVNPLRLRWLQTVGGDLANQRLLDVGCGGGIFAEAAARAGARVTAVDAAEQAMRGRRSGQQRRCFAGMEFRLVRLVVLPQDGCQGQSRLRVRRLEVDGAA